MAGRPDKYYRAGHWVNRSAGGRKPAKKSMTGLIVAGLLVVGAWLGLFSHGSDESTQQPASSTSSAPSGR
jgi:hypothetical protein